MPEVTPASEGGTGTGGPSATGAGIGVVLARAEAQLAARFRVLAEALHHLPSDDQRQVAEAVAGAVESLAAVLAQMVRTVAGVALPVGVGAAAGPTGESTAEPTVAVARSDVPVSGVGVVVSAPAAASSESVEPAEPPRPEGEGVDAVAQLAARLVAQARQRRGVVGDPSRGLLDDPHLQPPPQVAMTSIVPFSDDPDRPDRRRGAPTGTGVAPAASGAPGERSTAGSSDPVAAALAWAATTGRRVVVGFADVVGMADPATATRLLQTRVLGALAPGDVAVMVGAGEVAFVLADADLVEADRRFRHLIAPPAAAAPAIRLGFAVPRAGEEPDAVVRRAHTAATGRWSRVRSPRPT